jgi:hypothetical protein
MPYIYPNDPYFNGFEPHQSRRGTTAQVANYVAASGEIIFNTDTKKVFVGDGTTPGGILISGGGEANYDFGPIIS